MDEQRLLRDDIADGEATQATPGTLSPQMSRLDRPSIVRDLVGMGDGGLQVLWKDGERIFWRTWDKADEGNCTTVLAVLPVSEHPTPSFLDRLAHECRREN